MAEWQVKRTLHDCDLFLAIGTSGVVAPTSNYMRSAEYAGARAVYIILEPMSFPNPKFKNGYIGNTEEFLPAAKWQSELPS